MRKLLTISLGLLSLTALATGPQEATVRGPLSEAWQSGGFEAAQRVCDRVPGGVREDEPVVLAGKINRARTAPGETLKFYCQVPYSSNLQRQLGIYSLTYANGNCTLDLIKAGEEYVCLDGAAGWTPDGYYVTRSNANGLYRWVGDIRLYRTSDWSLVNTRKDVKQYEFFYNGNWDYARNRLFMPFDQDSLVGGRLGGYVDVPSLTTHVARDRGFWLPGFGGTGVSTPQTWAIDADGNVYIIAYNGKLYRSSGVTNTQVEIGDTKLGTIGSCGAYIDPLTHIMYVFAWGVGSNSKVDGLYRIDLRTAKTELLYKAEERVSIQGLYMPDHKLAEASAPAAAKTLTWKSSATGSLQGKIAFTAPSTKFDGTAAAGELDYAVVVDCDTVKTGKTTYGAAVEVDHTFGDTNFHNIRVSFSANGLNSPYKAIDPFVGQDGPKKPEQPKLTYANGTMTLKWTAPTESAHGGDWTPSAMTYTVKRMPENVTVAENLKATSFSEAMAEPAYARGVYYTVSANSDGITGTGVLSDTVFMGKTTLPYDYNFSNREQNAAFAIHNPTHHRDQGWKSNAGNKSMIFYYGSENGNAWFISPAFRFDKGKAYRVDYEMSGTKLGYTESFEVKAGMGNRPENMTITVQDTTGVESVREKPETHKKFFRYIVPTQTGDHNIGIHCVSRYALYYFYCYNLAVDEGLDVRAPYESTDMEFVPTDKSAPKGNLLFKAPTKDFNGNALSGTMTVKVYRDSVLVKTLEGVKPGSAQTVSDVADKKAQYNYRVIAYNTYGEGAETQLTAYVGANVPGTPHVTAAYEGAVTGTVTVKWDAPTLDKDKNPINPNIITYQILTSDSKTILADSVKGNECTVKLQEPDAAGVWATVRVKAQTSAGSSSAVSSTGFFVGVPETLPFDEPIEGGKDLKYAWRTETKGNVNWGNLVDFQGDKKPSQNGDNGYWGLNMNSVDYGGRKLSPKVTLTGDNPTLSFWIYCKPGNDNTMDVLVNESGNYADWGNKEFVRFTFDEPKEGWYRRSVSLAPFKGKTIQFGLYITCKRFSLALIDHINIDNPKPIDMEAGRFNIDKTLTGDSAFHVVFPFINIGTQASGAGTVEFFRNGNIFHSQRFNSLQPGAMDSVVWQENVTTGYPRFNNYQANIVLHADADTTNNRSRKLQAELPQPDLARIFTLRGEENGDHSGAALSWSPADLTVAASDTTDDAESLVPFSTGMTGSEVTGDNTGQWIFVDRDGRVPRKIVISNKTYDQFPNASKPFGFMVWNHEKAGITSTAWKGNNKSKQAFMSLGFDGGKKDDWLISPVMPDCEPDVSMWVRSCDSKMPKEQIEIWVSKGSANPDDFVRMDELTLPGGWGRLYFTMPAGYTRFAIRAVTENSSALLIDDITFAENSNRYKDLQVKGYNVYRNGVKLNSAPLATTAYKDVSADRTYDNVYTVTTVFNRGESGSSNEWVLSMSNGVNSVTDGQSAMSVTTEGRNIVVNGADGLTVMVVRPDGIWEARSKAANRCVIPVEGPGIYIVRAGSESFKVIVK